MYDHFLDLKDFSEAQLRQMLSQAAELKAARRAGKNEPLLAGKTLAMLFEKPSTRTRVSFEVGMTELGGSAIHLSRNDMQLGHGESIADTARVLSRFVDAIMLRCHGHETLLELAEFASVPVINGLTDYNHPCQIMADILTFEERLGSIKGKKIAWVGDGNNVANTWITAAERLGFVLQLACPPELAPDAQTLVLARERGAEVSVTVSPEEAVEGASAVVADTWVSMGQENAETRKKLLQPYQVNTVLMQKAASDAIFMHCLPAHRGEEVTDEIIDGAQSVVWDEAENRLHVQKAIMLHCFKH